MQANCTKDVLFQKRKIISIPAFKIHMLKWYNFMWLNKIFISNAKNSTYFMT